MARASSPSVIGSWGTPTPPPMRRRMRSCSPSPSATARASASRSSAPRARRAMSFWGVTRRRPTSVRGWRPACRARRRGCAHSSARHSPSPAWRGCATARSRPCSASARRPSERCWRVRGCALHDELHGTALAAAAVRSPDCEEVLALLGAAADGELGPADAGWADPHVTHCATCPRTRRALEEAAATYAAWSPAVAPRWLRAATLAELGAEVPAVAAPAAAAATSPRLGLSTAVLGAALLGVAFAALALSTAATLRQGDPATHGNGLADATRSLQVAGAPTRAAARPPARRRAVRHVRRARRAHHRPQHVVFVPVRAVTPAHRPTVAGPRAPRGRGARRRAPSAGRRRRRPRLRRRRRPSPRRPPARTPRPTSCPAAPTARPRPPCRRARRRRPAPAPATAAFPASAPSAQSARGEDHDRGDGWHRKQPCPPAPRCRRGSCGH